MLSVQNEWKFPQPVRSFLPTFPLSPQLLPPSTLPGSTQSLLIFQNPAWLSHFWSAASDWLEAFWFPLSLSPELWTLASLSLPPESPTVQPPGPFLKYTFCFSLLKITSQWNNPSINVSRAPPCPPGKHPKPPDSPAPLVPSGALLRADSAPCPQMPAG